MRAQVRDWESIEREKAMGLYFEEHESPEMLSGGSANFIACDTCAQKIQGQEDGIVVFHEDAQHVKDGNISVIHKGRCETAGTRGLRWEDLEIFLRDVVLNTKIDLAKTESRIRGTDGLTSWGLHS
jgi:hypothetical protein